MPCTGPYSLRNITWALRPTTWCTRLHGAKTKGDFKRFALFQWNASETNLSLLFGYLSGVKNILTKVFSRLPELGGGEERSFWRRMWAQSQKLHVMDTTVYIHARLWVVRSMTRVWGAGTNIWILHPAEGTPVFRKFLPSLSCSPSGALRANFLIWWLRLGAQWLNPGTELWMEQFWRFRITSPAPRVEGELFDLSGGLGGGLGVGGRNGWMEPQVPRLAASLSCFSLPTSSSVIPRARRKVV